MGIFIEEMLDTGIDALDRSHNSSSDNVPSDHLHHAKGFDQSCLFASRNDQEDPSFSIEQRLLRQPLVCQCGWRHSTFAYNA